MRTLRPPDPRALLAGAQIGLALLAVVGMAAVAIPRAEASRLVVSSAVSNRYLRFAGQTGAFLSPVMGSDGGLTFPDGIAFGPDGNLYVRSAGNVLRYHGVTGLFMNVFVNAGGGADANNQSFQIRYDGSPNFIVTPTSGGLDGPTGLTFGPDGHLYVSSYGLVQKFHGQTGASLGTFTVGGPLIGANATGLAFGPDGHLYVSCFPGNTVLKYHGTTGAFLGTFVTAGLGGLDRPIGLGFGPDGNLLVCSYNSDQVLRYNGSTGAFLGVAADGNGLDGPTGLTFGPDDNMYVASHRTDSVLRFDPATGAFVDDFVPAGSNGLDGPFCPVFMLQAPTTLATTLHSATEIRLTWTDSSEDETGFEIERKANDGPFAVVAVVAANSTSFANVALNPNTVYTYRVRGVYGAGESAFTNESAQTTPANPPTAPTALSVAKGDPGKLVLSWSDNSGNELVFQVFRTTTGSSYQKIADVAPNTTTYIDSGLTPNAVWTYKVRATNGGGDSAFTNEAGGTPNPLPPTPPSGLTAHVISASQINLSWTDTSSTDVNFETSFTVWRKGPVGDFAQIATLPANATSHSDTTVDPDTAYSYRVQAANGSGPSDWSNTANGTTPQGVPDAPTLLDATPMSGSQINLVWNNNSDNATAVHVFRKGAVGDFVQVATLIPDATSYNDTGLNAGAAYTYRVRAVNEMGPSDWTNDASATTPNLPPAAPTNLAASPASPTRVNLAWQDRSNNEAEFVILRQTGSGAYARMAVLPPNTTTYGDTTASPNTTYKYIMRAVNSAGASAWSNEASATTPNAPPAAPTNLQATAASAAQINLSWQDRSSNEAEFVILRQTGSGAYARVAVLPPNTTTYGDTTASPNTTYKYIMRAVNSAGASAWSNEASATTPLGTPPAAPTNLQATAASAAQINLSWQDRSSNEAEFVILRQTGSGAYARVAVLPPNTTTYGDTTVSPNTTYKYIMRAVNSVGASAWSNEASATTPLGTPPATPAFLRATVASATRVNLSWQDRSNNEAEFVLMRRTGSGLYARVAVLPANTITYADMTVSPGTTYTYIMRAVNSAGASTWSNESSVTTPAVPPAAPANLTATAASPTRINLTWQDKSNNETEFVLMRRTGSGLYARVAVLPPNTTAYADTTVSPGTTYTYIMRAGNSAGASAWSNESSATTP